MRSSTRGPSLFASTAFAFIFLLTLPGNNAGAETFEVPRYGYFFDVPETWEGMDIDSPEALSFRRIGEDTVFQALTMSGETFADAGEIYRYISSALAIEGEPASYADRKSVV